MYFHFIAAEPFNAVERSSTARHQNRYYEKSWSINRGSSTFCINLRPGRHVRQRSRTEHFTGVLLGKFRRRKWGRRGRAKRTTWRFLISSGRYRFLQPAWATRKFFRFEWRLGTIVLRRRLWNSRQFQRCSRFDQWHIGRWFLEQHHTR